MEELESEPEPEPLYEIQEYSSFKGGHENSMMKWILNKGYGIGKKMAITGIAISAAPLVLPPIVVFSAMGVAFSIPSGFVFASYACTNKLMTTLLPIPPSPVILEYYTDENEKATNEGVELNYSSNGYRQMNELEKGYYLNEYDDELYPENVMQEENEEGSRALDSELEALVMQAGWEVNESEEEKHRDGGSLQMKTINEDKGRGEMEDTEQDVEMSHRLDAGSNTNFGGGVDEQGYEEDLGEYLEGDDDSLEEEHKREESLVQSRIDENENIILTEDNEEEMDEESTGILEKVGDEGRVDDDTTEDDHFLDESVSNVVYEADNEVETPEPFTVDDSSVEDNTNKADYVVDESASNVVSEEFKDVETTKPVTVTEASVEDNTVEDDNFLDESASNVVLEHVEDDQTTKPVIVRETETEKLVKDESKNDEPVGEMHRVAILSPGDDGNIDSDEKVVGEVEELDLVAREVVGEVDQDAGNIDSDEKVMRESMGTQEETSSDIHDEGTQDTSLRTRKDHLIHAKVDAMKIDDETGLVLFDDQSTSMKFEGLKAGGEAKGTVDENVDVSKLPAFRRVALDTDNAEVMSKTNTKTPSREDVLNDKIWDKIGEKRFVEHMGENSSLKSKLDENKGKELLLESKFSDDKSKTQEVTEDSLEGIVKGSTGLLEKIRDKGTVNDNTLEHDHFSVPNVLFEETMEAEKTEPVTIERIETQILVKCGSKNNETIGEMHHAVLLSAGNEQNNFNSREVEDSDLGSKEVVEDFDEDGGDIDCDEKVTRTGGGISDQGTKEDHMIHANADAREMGDESGLGLFDDQKTSMEFQSSKGGGASKESVVDQNADELALPAFRQVSLDTDSGSVTSKMKAKTPSREDVLDDEKLWEKIVAMRTIVGYSAPSQPTCMAELKALYVFTGVEPPASFESNTDLDEVNGKLKFLMAIVGVK